MQWAQQLTGSQDLNTEAAGCYMLDYPGTSGLASSDDTRLLFRLTRPDELDAEASAHAAAVDVSDYVVDDRRADTNGGGQMTVQDAAETDGVVPDRDATESASPAHGERRVVKVSRAAVAAAYAQVNLSTKLGLPVPPAVAKIAALARPYGPSVPGSDGVSGG